MKAKDVVANIKTAVEATKAEGHSTVSIDALMTFLEGMDKEAEIDSHYQSLEHQSRLTNFKAENDRHIAAVNNANTHSLEMFRSVITTGQSALKSSMIINGGAAVALLAFSGKIWQTETSQVVANSLTASIIYFCLGVLLVTSAAGTTYLAQYAYSSNWYKAGHTANIYGIFAVVGSYALFALGAFTAAKQIGIHFGL